MVEPAPPERDPALPPPPTECEEHDESTDLWTVAGMAGIGLLIAIVVWLLEG